MSFRAEDAQAGLFVGREEETVRLRRMVAQRALVVVVGPSGVGKSSLVTAGLFPALLGTGEWTAGTFRPGETPFFALARALYDLEGSGQGPGQGLSPETVDRRGEQIRDEGLAPLAGKLSMLIGKRVLLHADQFEEMLTTCPEGERAEFLDRVLPAANVDDLPYRLICTLRADFLRPLLEHADVGPRLQDRLLPLSPMSVAALERAVSEPARVRGVSYEDGLAAQIASDAAGGGGGLPLMEFALTELWARQRRRRLTFADYHSLGGVAGALNRYAEGVFAELAERGLADRVQRVMLALVCSREGAAQATRRVVERDRLARDWDVVEELARVRLLTISRLTMNEDTTGGTATAELAHEALIRSWSRFATWVDSDAGFQRWLVTMEDRVAEDELLPEARISEADRWLAERPDDIPAEVRELVERSRTLLLQRIAELEDARSRAEEATRQAEDARRQVEEAARQRTRRLRQFIATLTVLLLVAVSGFGFALQQRATAQRERDTAIFNQITAQADRLRSTDVSLAAQLDLTAYRIRPTSDLYTDLVTDADATLSTPLTGHTDFVRGHRQWRPDGAVVERGRPDPPHPLGPAPDRPHQRRLRGGVQSGWAHPGHRQHRPDGAVVERD